MTHHNKYTYNTLFFMICLLRNTGRSHPSCRLGRCLLATAHATVTQHTLVLIQAHAIHAVTVGIYRTQPKGWPNLFS